MDKRNIRIVSLLLIFLLITGLLTGCSKAGTKIDEKLELAVKYLSEQKYEEAILSYKEVIKIDSKNVTAYKGISLAYVLQEKPNQAEQALQDGLKAVPQNTQLQLAMAGLMAEQGKNDQAETIYKDILAADKTNLSAYQAYTDWLVSQNKKTEAITLLEKAIADNQNQYRFNSLLAGLYIDNGDNAKALASINQSLNQQTDQSEAYKLLEKIYANRWSELLALGDQYIQQNQAKTGQLIKLTALFNQGSYEELIKQFENLPAEIKDSAKARLLASQAYLKLGKPDQAGDTIKMVQTGDLKDAGILANLASYYLDAGDKEKARKLAMLGIGMDDTAIDNYVIMYKATDSKIWLYKYILGSLKGSLQAINDLKTLGLSIAPDGQVTSGLTSEMQRAVHSMLPTPQEITDYKDSHPTGGRSYHGYCYYDQRNNIAYVAYLFGPNSGLRGRAIGKFWTVSPENSWKLHIFRIHNPKFKPASVTEKSPEYQTYLKENNISQVLEIGDDDHPVHQGDFSFEEAVQAGYEGAPIWVDLDYPY